MRYFLPVLLLAVATHAQQPASPPQTAEATVVVFTPGSHWRGTGEQFEKLLFGTANEMSMGEFFDGKTRIAYLTHSRYLVLRLPSGPHIFSASMSKKHPDRKQTMTVDLKPDSVNFFALTATLKNWGLGQVVTQTAHLATATCEEFEADHQDNHSQAVETKHVTDAFRQSVNDIADLPQCKP
jgi:hypothetical protein